TLAEGVARGLFRAGAPRSRVLQAIAARTPAFADLELKVQQSGGGWTMEVFLLVSLGLSLALGLPPLVMTQFWPLALVAAALGALLPYLRMSMMRRRRIRAFEAGLPEAIDLL